MNCSTRMRLSRWSLSTINAFESISKRKTAAIRAEIRQSDFVKWQPLASCCQTYLETLQWEVLPHPSNSPDIAPSDFHLLRSMALTNAFILTKKLKIASILGQPQKTYRFSDAEFIYYQKDGRKWSLVMGNTLIEMFSLLIF